MQTILCSLIVVIALLYVANRWLPAKLKHRALGKTIEIKSTSGSCGSCSSCGNCGSEPTKLAKK